MPAPETLRHLSDLYSRSADPWDHDTSAYERDKHAETVKAAGRGPHREALEIGCGNGALAARLAPLCARLTVIECIPAAAALARDRLRVFPHVTVIEGDSRVLPVQAPDLVVLSEMLYFLPPREIADLASRIDGQAAPDCRVVSVNWLGSTDEELSGREAADFLAGHLGHWRIARHGFGDYIMDVFDAPRRAASPPREGS